MIKKAYKVINNIETALKPYLDKRICPKILEDASLAAGPWALF